MTRDEILKKMQNELADHLGVNEDEVKLESTFMEDLGADSLDLVELTMMMEEEFDLTLSDEEEAKVEQLRTVGDAIEFIFQKVQ